MICRRSRTSPPAARRGRSAMSSGCKQEFPDAQPALGYGLTETNAVGCANFWSNYAAKPASTGRAQKPLVEVAILGEGDRRLPTGEVGEIAHPHRREHQRLLAQSRKRPRRCSPPTASSAPATSAISTRTAICSSSTARRTSSSAAARISRRRRSRPKSTPALRSPRRRCSARPTSGSARCRSRSSLAKDGERLSEERASRFPRRTAGQVQDPGADHLRRRAAAAPRHRQDRPPRAEGPVRAIEGRSPDSADRRRRGHRPDRRLRAVAASLAAATSPPGAAKQAFGNFIKIARDGRITVAVPQVETGQGIWTALAADRRRRAWRGMGDDRGRAGAAGRRLTPTRCAEGGGLARRRSPDHRRTRPRSARSSSRCVRRRRSRGRCWSAPRRTAGMSTRATARPPTGSSSTAGGRSPSASSPRKRPTARRRATARFARRAKGRLIGQPLQRLDGPAKADGSWRFAGDVRLPGHAVRVGPDGAAGRAADAASRARRSQRCRAFATSPPATTGWRSSPTAGGRPSAALKAADPNFSGRANAADMRPLFEHALAERQRARVVQPRRL